MTLERWVTKTFDDQDPAHFGTGCRLDGWQDVAKIGQSRVLNFAMHKARSLRGQWSLGINQATQYKHFWDLFRSQPMASELLPEIH